VPLPGSERKGLRQAGTVGHQVDLDAKAAAREAEGVVLRLFGISLLHAPAADRLARTEVLSMHHSSRSISPFRVQLEPQPVQKRVE
jgi:hypothetical protein